MREWSRRRYLLSVVAGGAAGLAGCSQLPDGPLSGGDRTGTYLDWLPAPSALDTGPYATTLVRPSEAHEHESDLHPATRRVLGRKWNAAFPEVRDALGRTRTTFEVVEGVVVHAGVPVEDPVGSLTDLGYREGGSRGDFTILRWNRLASDLEFAPKLLAVGEDAVVRGFAERHRRVLEAVVDAHRGTVPRFHEEVSRVKSVGTRVGERTFTVMDAAPDSEEPAGVVAVATGWQLDGDVASLRMAIEFEDDADARVADVRGTVGGQWLRECWEVSVGRDGATVELSASIAIGRFDLTYAGDPGEDGIPNAEFELSQDLDEAVATHAGPEPVPAAELEVALYTGLGTDQVESSRTLTDRQFADVYDVVEEGDSMAFAPDGDGELRVEWVHPESGDRLALGSARYDG